MEITVKDKETEVYNVDINESSLYFEPTTKVLFDSDGDCIVDLHVKETDLLEHISDSNMINYLEEQGYTVMEEE